MEPDSHDAPQPFAADLASSSSPSISRTSSTLRLRPHKYRSNSSLNATSTPTTPDDQSLTSFPSLSPSIETSPQPFGDHALTLATPKASANRTDVQALPFIPPAFEGLFSPTTVPGQSALFDDAPQGIRDVPGTLHYQKDEHVEHLIAKQGAVTLVKQLAQDLARRDAQMTLLQRRAEERESLLRKMLRECEVSNLDIENRLRELRKSRNEVDLAEDGNDNVRQGGRTMDCLGTRPEASMRDRLAEAFGDAIERGNDMPSGAAKLPLGDNRDLHSTVRGPRNPSIISADARSTASGWSTHSQKAGTKGWKDYLRYATGTANGATTSREAFSQVDGVMQQHGEVKPSPMKRTRHSTEPQKSLPPVLSRTVSHAESFQDGSTHHRDRLLSTTASDSVNSTNPMTSWAMKLVAGPPKSSGIHSRDRAATVGGGTLDGSNAWKSSTLSKSKSPANLNTSTVARTSSSTTGLPALGPTGTVRKVAIDINRNPVSAMLPSTGQDLDRDSNMHLGPVEMDTILPEDTRPPTLVQYNNYGSSLEFLTDRFGFIYDQRRRRRQNEAAAALILPKIKRGNNFEVLRGHRQSLDASVPMDEDAASFHSRASSVQTTERPETPASIEDQSDEQPAKRWQDYLKLSNFSTELLSHTPSAAPITDITTGEPQPEPHGKAYQIVISKKGSLPPQSTNPAPSPTRIVSDNAELALPSVTDSSGYAIPAEPQPDLVKSLLDQVNDVHDSLQRDRTVKWNEFLRKVRAERRRDGEQSFGVGNRSKHSAMPESLLANGELIGVAGLGVKGKIGRAKGVEFRNLVLSGIPVTYRAKIWAESCGALALRVPGYYEELVASSFNDAIIAQQIQMDITRTLTDNIFFRKGQGVHKLNEVLLAYARRNPEVGYCQGMNLITANLLLIMPTAEDAFWILTSIVEYILPPKYYDNSLLASRVDQIVLRQYVADVLPQLSSHLEALAIDLEAVTFQWFLSVFTDCLSAEALFRVWDVVLCLNDGATFLFQVALALLKLNEKALLGCDSPAEVYGYINQRMTDHAISIDGLIRASEGLKKEVRREDITERRTRALELELDLVRQREEIRKGKTKAVFAQPSPKMIADVGVGLGNGTGNGIVPHGTPGSRRRGGGRLTRQSSRADFDEDELDPWGGELQVRTPMPIDEEASWRA